MSGFDMIRAGTPSNPRSCRSAAILIISTCPASSPSACASRSADSAVFRECPAVCPPFASVSDMSRDVRLCSEWATLSVTDSMLAVGGTSGR